MYLSAHMLVTAHTSLPEITRKHQNLASATSNKLISKNISRECVKKMEFPDGSGICLAFRFWKFHRGGEVRSYGKSLLWGYGYFLELLDEYLWLTFALKSDMEITPCFNFVSYKQYLAYNRVKLSFLSEYSFAFFIYFSAHY